MCSNDTPKGVILGVVDTIRIVIGHQSELRRAAATFR